MREGSGSGHLDRVGGASGLPVRSIQQSCSRIEEVSNLNGGSGLGETVKTVDV